MKHVNLRIQGKVQGVGFRMAAKEQADDLGIKGFVRNDADGSVYMEAEGIEEAILEFVEWCHEGPPAAGVENVEVEGDAWVGFESFDKVRRFG